MRQDYALLLYALVKGYDLNVGRIIEQSILDYVNGKFPRNIPHPTSITLLCIKEGVTFSEVDEERYSKASSLTLTGITKGSIKGEEGKIREKRKRGREQRQWKFNFWV